MVSVIIPVYQVSDYVERCIRSVMEQTFTDIECIIVDDATEDDSIVKCERLIKGYNDNVNLLETAVAEQATKGRARSATKGDACPSKNIRFKILHHEVNRGLSAARNTGIDAANGEYIYFLDGDDEITPDCIEKLVAKAIEDQSIEMVQGSHVRINNEKKELFVSENIRIVGNDEVRNQFLKWRNINYCAWNKLLKRSFIVENGLCFKEGIIHEELLWTFYLIKFLKKAYLCHEFTYYYKLRPGSIVTGKKITERGKSEVIVYDEILHNLTAGKERDELYGLLYNFCEVLANYMRCTPELKRIQREYRQVAWQHGCWYVCLVLTIVAVISRFGNPMVILKKLNMVRWWIRGKSKIV